MGHGGSFGKQVVYVLAQMGRRNMAAHGLTYGLKVYGNHAALLGEYETCRREVIRQVRMVDRQTLRSTIAGAH